MANFDTIKSITDNLETISKGLGIKFSRAAFADAASIPASLIPHGRIIYSGERFENTHGERPGYVEASFDLLVVVKGRRGADVMRTEQDWVHRLRGAFSVAGLNTGELASSKLVSRVDTTSFDMDNGAEFSVLTYKITVRYREL
ncbi:MAG: hypothetical protein V3T30_08870 [Thermodesulfobacteriota bacterium]